LADVLRGGIAINEILVDPNGSSSFDTDGNGSAAATDEFIEIVNVSNTAISIAGLQLWDKGIGQWFTFPAGAVLQPGAHALVITGVQAGGSLPTGTPDDLFFNAGRASAVITNTGDNVIIYDPSANTYISARFNGTALDNPTLGGGGYTGFSSTAILVGAGENFGNDIDGNSIQRGPDGSSVFVNNETPTPGTFNVCFTAGTLVETPQGPVAIETLRIGDLVLTGDHGARPVAWIWAHKHTPAALAQNEQLRPVRIARHALGHALPTRDLFVSQQHRILIASRIAQRIFGAPEVLVSAKTLIELDGVDVVLPDRPITYIHLLFSEHEIIFAEGTPSESLYLGPQALRVMDGASLAELELLLGLDHTALPRTIHQPARLFAVGKKARLLVERHIKNQKALLPSAALLSLA
jgi:hypothetical protein